LIRPYVSTDAEAIGQIIADYRAENGRVVDRAAIAAALAVFAASAQDRILVAEAHGTVVGYVAFHVLPFPMIEGLEAYVSDLIVAGGTRGAGVGSQLLKAVEAEARRLGCVRLMLNNHKTDVSYVRRFYRKHDFKERDDFGNFVKSLADR
jgi:GNAT superfamily N-acetyltransferase